MDVKIFVALDTKPKEATKIINQLAPNLCGIKIGKELFTWAGPKVIEYCNKLGFKVFLDLKFCDIPNTVAKAAIAAASHDIYMFTIHATGGQKMIRATRDAIDSLKMAYPPKILAVTLLTSISQADVNNLRVLNGTTETIANDLCKLSLESGANGIVCSPLEVAKFRESFGDDFLIVTPGIRPLSNSSDDQSRIATPQEAISSGSNFLVIGRPITQSTDPIRSLEAINSSIRDIAPLENII